MTAPNDPYSRLVRLLIGPLEVDFALVSPEVTIAELELDSLAAEEFVLLAAEEFGTDDTAPYDLAGVPLAELAARLAGAAPGDETGADLADAPSPSGLARVSG
ncbi:hypothetical protein OHV05_02785 [Kitasatospora sp. NBC_00070]|uniref:hypothetical protein n=1 Tax=Kitasatospora sp. NBC_00070 TaxID=2975962 RepID=UPI0032514471